MVRTFLGISVALLAICILSAQPPAPPAPAAPKQTVANPGRVTLVVINSVTKAPVNRATVRLQAQPEQSATTDASGRVEFEGVPAGTYRLSLQAPGYLYEESGGARSLVTVTANQLTDHGNALLTPLAVISGTIVDENEEPMPGVTVLVGRVGIVWGDKYLEPKPRATAVTDDRGIYRIPDIDAGRYIIRAAPPATTAPEGFAPLFYPASPTAGDSLRVQVNPGGNLNTINFRFHRQKLFHIRGTLTGSPNSALVLLIESCPDIKEAIVPAFHSSARINADDSFDAAGLPPGTYCLRYEIAAGNTATRVTSGDPIRSVERVVTILDKDVENLKLVPEPTTLVSGVVEGVKNGDRLPSLRIRAIGERRTPFLGQITLTGKTSFTTRLPAGDYEVQITSGSGYLKGLKLGGQLIPDGKFRLSGDSATLTLQIEQGKGHVTGSIELGDDKPGPIHLPIMLLMLPVDPGMEKRRDLTAIGLTFDNVRTVRFDNVAPGTYKVYAWKPENPGAGATEVTNEVMRQLPGTTVTVKDGETANVQVKLIPLRQFAEAMTKFEDLL